MNKISIHNDWAITSLNFMTGCQHNCLYCYAKAGAVKYKQVSPSDWEAPKIRKHDLNKNIKTYSDIVMFPSSHDITPAYLEESILFLSKILKAGNKVLIVSKPYLECINKICNEFQDCKNQILFRFTIGSTDDEVLKFWEPGAPNFQERFASLKYAYEVGFQTSVSCEPMLDDKIIDVVNTVTQFVTETIWLGKANGLIGKTGRGRLEFNGVATKEVLEKAKQLIEFQSDNKLIQLYLELSDNPKIRWKKSIRHILEKYDIKV